MTMRVGGGDVLDQTADLVLGDGRDSMDVVSARLAQAYPQQAVVAWQGDAQTFQFQYVSDSAEAVLGYPARRWIEEPTFWADVVIVPEDREESVAYCALATARKRDHIFEYRARTKSGGIVVLRDMVRVVLSPRGIPQLLRGLMFDVTAERASALSGADLRAHQRPSHAELLGAA